MTEKASKRDDAAKIKEAQNLAQEGVDAMQHGDKEEGKFLLDAAKDLDEQAASVAADKARKEDRDE